MTDLILFNTLEYAESIKKVLSEDFEQISKELKSVMKVASKGRRKGFLIFKPEAARIIYRINFLIFY
jgi:esterase/lipase